MAPTTANGDCKEPVSAQPSDDDQSVEAVPQIKTFKMQNKRQQVQTTSTNWSEIEPPSLINLESVNPQESDDSHGDALPARVQTTQTPQAMEPPTEVLQA